MTETKKKAIQELKSKGFVNEARLLEALSKVQYGRVDIVMVGGKVDRIEKITDYDKLSKGL